MASEGAEPTHIAWIAAKNPRLTGLLLMGLGVALLVLNALTITFMSKFYPTSVVGSCAVICLGAWVVITGRVSVKGVSPQPLWWTIIGFVSTFAGGAGGAWLSSLLRK